MSKNKTLGRPRKELGRPRKELVLPLGKFTVNDLIPLNPAIKCRLTLYTRVGELVSNRTVRSTGDVLAGKVGKPLDIFQRVSSYRAIKARKAAAEARKLAGVVVDLTPSSAPVNA